MLLAYEKNVWLTEKHVRNVIKIIIIHDAVWVG